MRAAGDSGLRGRRRLRRTALLLVTGGLALVGLGRPARAQDLPYTVDEVLQILATGVVPDVRLAGLLRQRCVAFRAGDGTLQRLRDAGAGPETLTAVRTACRVLPGEPRTLRIEPDSVLLQPGERLTLSVRASGADGKPLERPGVQWSSEDPRVVSVDDEGRVAAGTVGMTRVTARATNDVQTSVRVWVREAPISRAISPNTALWVGAAVPGAGQFYTGQPVKGVLVFGGVAGSLAAALAVEDGDRRPLLVPGLLVAAGLWTYGALEAHSRAEQMAAASPRAPRWALLGPPQPDPDGGVRLPLVRLAY